MKIPPAIKSYFFPMDWSKISRVENLGSTAYTQENLRLIVNQVLDGTDPKSLFVNQDLFSSNGGNEDLLACYYFFVGQVRYFVVAVVPFEFLERDHILFMMMC